MAKKRTICLHQRQVSNTFYGLMDWKGRFLRVCGDLDASILRLCWDDNNLSTTWWTKQGYHPEGLGFPTLGDVIEYLKKRDYPFCILTQTVSVSTLIIKDGLGPPKLPKSDYIFKFRNLKN